MGADQTLTFKHLISMQHGHQAVAGLPCLLAQ